MKPFLRWAGSKRRLVPTLSEFWSQDYNRYIEPFVGSACLFFSLNPRWATLGDLNGDLIRTYKAVKAEPTAVSAELHKLSKSRSTFEKLRATDPNSIDSNAEAAARFIFLNRYCFNGLYRTNLKGEFNVPYAPQKSGSLPTLDHLQAASAALNRKVLIEGDFTRSLRSAKAGDFAYIDPPFAVSGKRVFREYGPKYFTKTDLERLAKCLVELDEKNVKFLVSYADCPEAKILSSRWESRKVEVTRNISGFAKHRREASELLINN